MARKARAANRLQRQSLAGQNLGFGFNVIIRVHDVVVRVRALERKYVRILAVDFHASRGGINRLHAERGNRNDGDHSKKEGKNQPLVLPQDQKVIVKMWFARREVKRSKARTRPKKLDGSIGRDIARN